VCPQHAIKLEGLAQGILPERGKNGSIEGTSLVHFLALRRSVRKFRRQMGNSHSYRFTVITESEEKARLNQELEKIYSNRRRILKCTLLRKVFLLFADAQTRAFLQDTTYLKRVTYLLDQMKQGEDPIFYNAPAVIVIHSQKLIPTPLEDSVLAAYNIVLMAQAMGLGTCYVSLAQNAINTSRKCKKILNLSVADKVYAVVVAGYPAVEFHRPVPKKPKAIHWFGS
jgi:nitroreductase